MVSGVGDEPVGDDVAVGEPAWSESFLDGDDVTGPASNGVLCDESSPGGGDDAALNGSLLGRSGHVEPLIGSSVGVEALGQSSPLGAQAGGCGLVEFDRLVEAVDAHTTAASP